MIFYRVLARASKGGGEPHLLLLVEFDVVTMECKEFDKSFDGLDYFFV